MLYRLYCDVLPLVFNKMSCTDSVQPENMIYTVLSKGGELEKSSSQTWTGGISDTSFASEKMLLIVVSGYRGGV